MSRVNCFIEDCRFNNNMKCNAPKVSFKLRSNQSHNTAEHVLCSQYRPLP
ncbi:DUF1540 domain-containing protein [Desulfoscipio gibsoniae]